MREEYYDKLKRFFRIKLLLRREELNLTQEQMSENLNISLRNYANLESGKYLCGTLTLVLFLIYHCPDANKFLEEIKNLYESDIEDANTINL